MDKNEDINFIFEIVQKNCKNRFITGFLIKDYFPNITDISEKTIRRQIKDLKNSTKNDTLQIPIRKSIKKSLETNFQEYLFFSERFDKDLIEKVINFTKESKKKWEIFIFYQYIIYFTIYEIREILKKTNTIDVSKFKYFNELNEIYSKEEIIEIFKSLIELNSLPNKEKFQKKFLEKKIFEDINENLVKKYIEFEDSDFIKDNDIDNKNLSEREKSNIKNGHSLLPYKRTICKEDYYLEYIDIYCLEQIRKKYL